MCAQAITIMYGANVQCTIECIVYDYIAKYTLTLEIIFRKCGVCYARGWPCDPPRQNGGVLDNKVNVGHFLCI
jgi:hypothetical protein